MLTTKRGSSRNNGQRELKSEKGPHRNVGKCTGLRDHGKAFSVRWGLSLCRVKGINLDSLNF